jgi:K+-transporting ATPase KdpF subunit
MRDGGRFLQRVYTPAPSLYKKFRRLPLIFSLRKQNLSEAVHGRGIYRGDSRLRLVGLCAGDRLRQAGGPAMNLFYVIGALTAAGLLVYLLVALLNAEDL